MYVNVYVLNAHAYHRQSAKSIRGSIELRMEYFRLFTVAITIMNNGRVANTGLSSNSSGRCARTCQCRTKKSPNFLHIIQFIISNFALPAGIGRPLNISSIMGYSLRILVQSQHTHSPTHNMRISNFFFMSFLHFFL